MQAALTQPEFTYQSSRADSDVRLHVVDLSCWKAGNAAVTSVSGATAFWTAPQHETKKAHSNGIDGLFEQHQHLREVVDQARGQLGVRFSGDAIALQAVTDPDEPDVQTLVLTLKTLREYDEAVSLWDKFKQEWWLPNYDRADGKLCILLDF